MRRIKDVYIVAIADLRDSFRSRRAILWIFFFLLASIIASSIFVYSISRIEMELAKAMHVSTESTPGTVTTSIWESDTFFHMMSNLLGDAELARSLIQTPPLALFYGWFILAAAPILIMMLSSESISIDVSSGAARFVLFRTSKLSWCLGKALGQAVLLLAALLVGGVYIWALGIFRLANFQPMSTAIYLLLLIIKTWCYSMAFLGLAFCISQVFKSVQLARSMGLLAYILMAILSETADHYSGAGWSRIWELVYSLTPQAHKLDLWRPNLHALLSGMVFSLALGALYFYIGHFIFSRKDL